MLIGYENLTDDNKSGEQNAVVVSVVTSENKAKLIISVDANTAFALILTEEQLRSLAIHVTQNRKA